MPVRTVLFASALALFGGMQLAGCAADAQTRSTGQVVDDSGITARVKTAIAREAGVTKAANINVNTYRGVVQLSGFVDSAQVVQRAEEIARNVEGVQSVKNDLRVSPQR